MPIFEYNGKKYNVRDEHIDSFMKDFPDASTIMEREGKKYRVKSADYRTFMSEQQQPEQSALDSTPETPVTPSAEEMPLTEQDKIRFSANIGQMKRRTEQMIDGFNERMETMREYHENAPLGGGQTAEGKMQFNPESGKLEKTYITPLGNRYTSKGLADMESFRYRQAADMSVNGQLRRAMLKLAELQEKREASAKRVHEQWEEDTKKNTAPLGFLLAADTYVPRQMSDKENSTLDVAIRQTEELIKDLEEQKDREQGIDVGFWRGFGRVAGDFRTWDFGMSDMRDALTMMNADDLKGENATEGEREAYNEMMGALYNKGQAEQMYGGNAGFWNRAGMMTGHMPAFMLDFGITGGGFKGINVLSKAGTKAATKVVGKETVEQMAKQGFKTYVKDNGVKGLGQYATNWTIKALGTTADDLLLRAPLMTNTVQAGKTTADIIDRKLGDVVVDENGNYDFSNDKTWGNAIWQGEANAIVENYSEMFGSHLDPVVTLGNMSKLANVVGAKRIGAVLSKTDAGALDGIMGQTHQLFNKMGVSDYFGEVTEEYYGQLWRTMLNLDDAYQQNPDGTRTNLLATGQFHGDIWGGMALSMGLMGAGKATLSGVQYASMKHGVNKADARATELLGKEIWEPLRATIDLTTNDDIGSVAEGIVNDKDFSDDERAAILTYMERSLMMRGFNLGTLAQKRGGEQDEDVQSMNESYIDGYNLADPQEMTDAKNMRDYQRQRVSAIVDENTLGFLDIHPMNALEEMRNNGLWGESELETVIDYLNAKQVYDGMIQRVRDDIDARVEQSNAMVDARTNRTSGMIQGATMKQDDRRVYVVGGNLVQYADGSGIDNRASDGSIIVRDAETGALEQVSPDAVLNIDEPLNPSDEKMTAEEAIIQQFAQEASDKIDGVVTFNPGDTYTITGDDAQIQVQIVANEDGIVDNGDGTVNVSDGVNIFPLAKETIQQQADAANLARVAQFEQQRTIENAERKQEMQEAERPQYALNDIVSLTDENGVTVRGNITADADADGKYEVFTEAPINGKRVNLFTRDELDNMLLEHNGVAFEHPAENESNNGAENIPENDNNAPQNIPAMQRIPKDEQGNPLYEQADSDTAWDAIVEQTEGDEDMAQTVADGMVADKEEALKKLEKAKSKGGNSIAEKIASEKERKAAIDAAKQDLLAWQKIAGTANRRRMAADAERKRMADEAAALRKAEEEKLRAEREEAERVEREALNGVPDMVDDTPQDARARGYRRVNGHKIDRQEPLQTVQGKEVNVKFSNDVLAPGHVAVIDASLLQPSHIQGVRNPLHFIDEAQPKERNDEASVLSARKIAGNIRPEEITSSITAYTGAPTVNERGEVIQGNNRSDALRLMWESHPEQAEAYRQYLKDHAEEFGLRAEDIAALQSPVLVNMLHVDDAEAAYFANYDSDWANNHKTVVTAVNLEDFEKWIDSSHRKTKAFAEYKSVKSVEEQSSGTQVDRLSEIKSRIEELHKEQEAAHVQSDIFEEARIISEINDLFAEQRKLEQSNSNEETTTPTDAAYTITPAQYTTKRGKVLDMHLVEFNNELRDTVRKHTTMFAKQLKGWWDKEKQGFMMRSKEDAERLAEYATDAQSQPPLSLSDLSEVNDGNVQFSEPQQQKATKQEERQEYTPIWQYSVFVDKETGETTLSRDDVSGSIPIGDARFRQTTNSPEEMLDILRNPQNGMQEVLDAVGISLENKIKTRELDRKAKDEIRDKRTDFVVDKEMDNRYSVRTLMKMIDAEKQAVMDLGEKRGGDVYHEGNIIFLTKDSADKFANEVRTLINDMRSEQQQDNSQKKTEASGNRLVTDERYAELRERMRKKLLGQMNIGIDPEILAIGTEMAVYHLEKGSRKFAEYATAMIADLGDAIRPYLKAFYNGARDLPEVAENGLDADMTPYDEVQQFDVANFDKKSIDALATAETVTRETEVEQEAEIAQERIKKSRPARKKNEKKAVNSRNQTGGLFGDLLTENDKADAELHRQFAMTVKADMLAALDNGTKPYRSILDLRKRASELGMEVDNDGRTDILLQELVEDGLVRAAREVIERKGSASRESYDLICKLYEMQPTISARSSNRIKMQQYSTPLPMAWIAGRFAMADKADGSVLEPTAGNGMLVFTIPVGQVHVNELDKTRLDNLREQGFAQVTQQDATEPFDGDVRYDVVIANPPFGKREAVEYDGKKIPGLDPQITLNALSSMKDDGRAAIIIGGNMEYANNGAIKSMKPFFTYLYDHYNVKGVIDMGGGLYAKQGTTFPTRMILIDGRRTNEERAQTAVYPPVENKAIRKAESFDDLYEIINEVLNFNEKTNGTEVLRSQGGRHLSVADNASGETDGAGHNRQSEADDESGSQTERRGRTGLEGNSESGQRPVLGKRGQNDTVGETGRGTDTIGKPSTDGRGLEQRTVGNEPQPVDGVDVQRIGLGLKGKPKKRDLTEEKLPYRPHNTAFRLESVAPAAMVEAMDKVLSQIEAQHGSIDEFVKTELGYDTIAETYQALAAEQMDSVAMAIYQMKQEQALIIGDQTGVGKGRQMAALIRWAVQRGEKPVFITQKADLFSDIYRDLVDVGSGDLVPFIFNSDGAMVDSKGNTVHKPLSSAEMAKVFASGALPEEYDFAVLTYSQVNTGDVVSQQEMEEAAKKSGARTKKSKNVKNGKATPKATFLRAIAKDNYLFLDESHTAAGSSNTGAYLQSILRGAKAATFASATFAKRPDTMPLYAIRTAMSQAKVDPDKMISIIEKGGVTLQEIMSRELTNAGQMVRRERDMSDVVTDWKTITDPETVRRARENYDRTIAAFNAIIKFQEDYVKPMIEALDMELAVMAESAGVKRGTDKMGVENVPFASKTYNYTKQLMLALKVNAIADEVEGEINAGRHPVIALESTMESSIKDYAAGEIIDEPTFSASLLKGLDTVMQYTVKDEDGNERHERYSPQALGPAGEKAYYELQDFIRESTSDIFISPLDAIIERLNKKGYKVGELTGRNMYVERNDDGRVVVKRRTDKDKKKMQREFNSGVLDVLILNKSASTGISLHASEKFSDQRQRSMIIAQPLSDINDYMQMIGRIDRTGQVHRGYYINLGLPVPAENRFLMMLSTKLKSLNANTTTSQDSESNDVEAPDLLNKYGSQVVVEYLRDNVDIYEKMGTPLKKGGLGGGRVQASELEDYKPQEDDARKITGYVALLATKEQEEFYDDVVRRYNELIKYLNDTGSNDLKITVMPLRATTIEKRISSEGIDPDGNNPFARNSFVEKVEMDVLRKPMKADEIRKVIEQINKGVEPNTYLDNVIETIRKEDEVRIAAEDERYEKSKAKAIDDIAKQTEKINGQKKRSDEEKRVAIDNFIAETNEKVEAKHKDNILRLNTNSDQMMRRLRMFEVGKSYLVPDNLESMIFDFATSAIFCGYKTKDSKITASTTLAVFATLDGRRRIEIKLSQIDALRSIDKVTNDNWDAARATTLDNWDSQIPSETRKTGFIMTGNILQAIADTQDEYGGYPGQLISYTDIDGNVHDGILMPDKWNASMLKTSGAPLSSRLQQIKDYTPITSHDGKVEIMGNSWAKMFYLTVPKTKKDGAVYYENKTLLRAAGGNFYPYRGKLRADIPEERIIEVVKELAKLGVKVKDDTTDILQRNGIGAYNDDEVSYENDPVAKLLGQSRRTAKQRREFARRERQRMAERVESLAEKLHLDNVEVVTDASVLDGKKQRAKGFYSKSTGKITIVIPNHTSTFDVEQTLLHEAVAHYGLRQLFGEHFDTFLDNVFNNADENIRRRIVDMAAKNGWDFHKATEEYLASLAEDTEFENINASWWQQIKDFFLNMLHKIGFEDFRGVTLSDNELRYILWRSYENLAEPGRYRNILGEAADVAKQYELKVGNYAVSDPHHQTVAESDDALYRTGDPEIHERELARDRYERRVKSGMFQSQEALQDSMLGLKEAMTAILGKETNIEDVDGFENAYLGENRLSSVNKAEADAFAHTLFKPMLDEVAKLARTEAEREELTDYMMAKHGLERNTYMRNEAINNGATDADQTDYAGLTALTGMDNVADAETEAQIMVNDYEQAHDTTDLWKKVNAASKAILSKSYECGMMSKATFDKISDMYDFYIPLRGFDEKTSSEAYAYLTHKQSAFNAPIKKAEGRRSKADDPFANLQSMAEGAIMQGNRNKLVKQRFLNFALNHPSDLVSVSDIWVEYDTVADEWKPVFPDNIDSTDTPEVVERKMLDFETKMESLAQQYPDRYKHGKDTVNIPYRIVESRDMRQHQIVVKRGGRDYVITINGNPRAAQALNGQTNPDNDMSGAIGAILRAGENINRQLSAFYTTRNPDFIVSNFMRDMLYTNTMTWIRESPNYALRFHRNYMYANPVRIKQLLAKHRKGTLDMSNKTEAMFHQFMMNGGETGYANIRDIEQHKNDIRRELKKSNGKIPVKKAWDLLGGRFDEYNRAVENCARFAAFMTSREMGRSIDRAIYDAKEISVNFNKKGSGAKFYDSTGQTKAGNASALVSGLGRSGYVFWNAAIQGTANFGRQMKRHPAKAFTGIAAMFLLGAIVAYLGGDDDDDDDKNAYYNLPEYVRRSNILFRAGNSWVSIPLPVEYRAVYGMGELMISVLNGKEHLTDGEIAEAITGQATQILPIDFLEGGGGLNAFVPSAYKPLWEAYVAEKSWTGMPLYKDTPYNKDMPEWTKAYKSANKYIVGLANAMNEATGGDPYTKGTIDFNPAKIEYMLNGYFGGVFGTIDKLSKMVETVTGNREYDPRSFLLANRLVKAGDERTEYRAVNNEYFRLKEEHDRLKSRLKHYEEDTDNDIFDYAEKIDFLYNSPEYERYEIFEDYREDIDDLYNELKEAISDEERKDIEAELNELKKEMIEEMNKTRK